MTIITCEKCGAPIGEIARSRDLECLIAGGLRLYHLSAVCLNCASEIHFSSGARKLSELVHY